MPLYAVALCTKAGRWFTLHHTEWSVVAGVLMVVGWFATWDRAAAGWLLLFFVAGGAPMIARSYYLRWQDMRSVISYYQDDKRDEGGE